MRLLATTLGLATLAFSACDGGQPMDPVPQTAESPTANQAEYGNRLTLISGLTVIVEGDRVALLSEEPVVEVRAAEALVLSQALIFAGNTAAMETEAGAKKAEEEKEPWPPIQCLTQDPDEDAEAESEEVEADYYVAASDSTSGCPFLLEPDTEYMEALSEEAEQPVFSVSSDEPSYALGFWYFGEEQEEDRLVFANESSIAQVDDRVELTLPDDTVVLTPAEALALGFAAAHAGSGAASAVVETLPYPWPPIVCDPPMPRGMLGGGGCPFQYAFGPDLWNTVALKEGLPIRAGDPEAALVYTFGFWHRPQR